MRRVEEMHFYMYIHVHRVYNNGGKVLGGWAGDGDWGCYIFSKFCAELTYS